MPMPPKVSVALCTYNGARFLDEQLESLASQTIRPAELVVGDDGSTDGTLERLHRFAQRADFPVHIAKNPSNLGYAQNFAATARRCSGDLVAFCDQDDRWYPEKLDVQVSRFLAQPDLMMVASDSAHIDEAGERTASSNLQANQWTASQTDRANHRDAFETIFKRQVWSGHTMVVRRELIEAALPIPEDWGHDPWFSLLASALGPVFLIDRPLVDYRQYQGQVLGGAGVNPLQSAVQGKAVPGGYYFDQAKRWRALHRRLDSLGQLVIDREKRLRMCLDKADWLEKRAAMRSMSSPARAVSACKQLMLGRYHRLGQGWLAFGRDMIG